MKFLGMGDNVVDRYINKKVMFPGGNGVNFAAYARKCGAESSYLGVFADDAEGRLIRDSLIKLGVDVSACAVIKDSATERCDVVLVEGDRNFVGSSWETGKEHITLKLGVRELEYMKSFQLIHCGCYSEMEDEMKKIKDFDAIRTFDFSSEEEYRTDEYLKKICPYVDMALFSAEEMNKEQIYDLQKKVRDLGTKYVLVTMGIKGQVLFDGENEYKGVVKLITPVDTMGAGDSFFAAFVVYMVRSGWNKNNPLNKETVQCAFEYAAEFSSQNCLLEGSFGFATKY